GLQGGGELVQAGMENAVPPARRQPRMGAQVRDSVGIARKEIQFMSELVDDDIKSGVAGQRVGPRQNHRPALPGLPGSRLIILVHDAGLILMYARDSESLGVDDDFLPTLVQRGRQ